ncbi:hypothetical protein ACFL2L_00585 [Patescibacteria group bacterium]
MKILTHINNLKNKTLEKEDNGKDYLSDILFLTRKIDDSGGVILKLSKQSINYSINENFKQAKCDLDNGYKEIIEFAKTLSIIKTKIGQGIANSKINGYAYQKIKVDLLEMDFIKAREEFMEAKILFHYLRSSKKEVITPKESLLANFEIYCGGLSDFCGELLRKARLDIIQKNNSIKDIKKYHNDTKEIYALLSNFAFSNKSGIRTKLEHLKSYISAFEKMLYDMSKYRGR